ncbi:MAG: hypothetical protein EOP51_14525 [Sphingobacteriales bacterium]|nr:MAG: hypothetical protein EOP51_14525 [Sphingobacteriales bacterium]
MLDNFDKIVAEKTDAELAQIFVDKEKYQTEFYEAAVREINLRGIDTSGLNTQLGDKIAGNTTQLEEGKNGNLAYLILCLLGAIFGGVLGIFGGYIYAFSKTKGLDGEQYYVYNEGTRKFGKLIFYIGISVIAIYLVVKLEITKEFRP